MIVELRDERALDAALTGGKGSQLAALCAKGFPVPPGFVVTTKAFAAFIEAAGLHAEIESRLEECLPRGEGAQPGGALQDRIKAMRLPAAVSEALRARLLDCAPTGERETLWAVRSSAVAEDLAGASFAGQYDSILGVAGFEAVAGALLHCWASFFNPHALQYRRDRNIRDLRGAVVVQRLIPADAAGVCFTLDPVSGASDRVVINANFGLGESVVSGRVTPDTFVVDKATRRVTDRQVATKTMKITAAPGGTAAVAIDIALRDSASLSDEQAIAVAALAMGVEAQAGRPVDIEWAAWNGELFLLQSRPITAAGASMPARRTSPPDGWVPELNTPIDPRYPLYSNGNISEVLPGCITPLSWSYIGPTIEHAFRSQGVAFGAMEWSGPAYQVLGFFYHRPYVCVSFLEAVAARIPGMSPDTIHEEFVGPPQTPTPALTGRDLLPDRWPALARLVLTLMRRMITLQAAARECGDDIRRQREQSDAERLQSWSDARLLEGVRFSEPMTRVSDVHVWASSFAVMFFGMLRRLTRAWLGDDTLAAQMVTGIGTLPSADPAFGLYELARQVMSSPELQQRFDTVSDDRELLVAIAGDPALRAFRDTFETFQRSFGHRAVCEGEFRNPCWREDPAQVVALVRNYLQSGLTPPAEVRARQDRVRAEALQRLRVLSLPKRLLLRRIVTRTRRAIGLREELKDLIILRSDRARRIYAEVRARLVSRRQLAQPDDIYFLLGGEVADLFTGTLHPDKAAAIIARRRRDFSWCEALAVPKIQNAVPRTLSESCPCAQRESAGSAAGRSGRQLKGMGVSPGKVEGRARVILDPRTGSHIEPGEILVAPVTDAGWTPLFINAAGLVVEVGGLLSHGSVVAREYGLPAVVGVTGATEEIKTGDRISLDGSSGVVRLETRN